MSYFLCVDAGVHYNSDGCCAILYVCKTTAALCCTVYRVEPALFYLVFGESVLNDAVALTIFNIAEKFIGTDHGAKVMHRPSSHNFKQ
jgi:hypothetical protein